MAMKRLTVLMATCLLLLAAAGRARADLLPLTWINPLPQGAPLLAVTYGDAAFVAVGAGGAMLTSPDGQAWTLQAPESRYTLSGVAFGAGLYVAVGGGGRILTSADGTAWQARESGVTADLTHVIYAGERFVAVGPAGTVLTSPDGKAWRKQEVGSTDSLEQVAYGNGLYIATGSQGAHVLRPDGEDLVAGRSFNLAYGRTVAFGNGRFVSVGGGRLLTSTDGEAWSLQPLALAQAVGPAFAGGQFFTVGGSPATSADGETWQNMTGLSRIVRGVAYGAGRYVAVGDHGMIGVSGDGVKWDEVSRDAIRYYGPESVAYAGGLWVVAGGQLLTSADGVVWEQGDARVNCCTALAAGPERLVGVGPNGLIATSADGRTWVRAVSPTQHHLQGVVYGAGRFVAVGINGEILTSTDGLAWTMQDAGLQPYFGSLKPFLTAVAFTGDRFVAVGDRGTVLLSEDGAAWRQVPLNSPWPLAGVAAGDGLIVAVGASGKVLVSADDGETWRWIPRLISGDLSAVAHGGGRWVAVGDYGSVLVSADGLTWVRDVTGSSERLKAVAYGDGRFLLAGEGGNILSLAAKGLPAPACASGFPDVAADHPSCQAVALLGARKLVGGQPDGTFQPDRNMTRAEFTKVLLGALGKEPKPGGRASFSDVTGHWAYEAGYIQAAAALHAISGFPDGRFGPDLPVTRAEAVKIVAAALGVRPLVPGQDQVPADASVYADLPADAWYTGWVTAAHLTGLVGPSARYPVWTDLRLEPDQPITRGEATLLLANLIR